MYPKDSRDSGMWVIVTSAVGVASGVSGGGGRVVGSGVVSASVVVGGGVVSAAAVVDSGVVSASVVVGGGVVSAAAVVGGGLGGAVVVVGGGVLVGAAGGEHKDDTFNVSLLKAHHQHRWNVKISRS